MIRRCQRFFRPRFTYVEQPGYAMGAAAVQIILEGLRAGDGGKGPGVSGLRIGESCGEQVRTVRSRVPAAIASRR